MYLFMYFETCIYLCIYVAQASLELDPSASAPSEPHS
jgi:hypothetical protein